MSYLNNFIKQFNIYEDKVMKYMYKKYIKEKSDINYNDFKKKIYGIKRERIINQFELLKVELNNIKKANLVYNKNKKNDIIIDKTEFGYPDALRCHFIINHKNNFTRCKHKVIDGDEHNEFCMKHNRMENFYYDKYILICKDYFEFEKQKDKDKLQKQSNS